MLLPLRALAVFFALIALAGCTSSTAVRSEEGIKGKILRLTPLGSTRDQVVEVIEREGWKRLPDRPVGILKETHAPSGRGGFDVVERKVIGASSSRVMLGSYISGPFMFTSSYVDWAFDANGRLLEIAVTKSTDSP